MLSLKKMPVQKLRALETAIISETTNEPDPLEKSRLSLLLWVVQCVLMDKYPVPTHSGYQVNPRSFFLYV